VSTILVSVRFKVLTYYSFITHRDGYDRNHGPIPHINGKTHTVKVDGQVRNSLELSINDLKTRFTQHEIVSALQCAGNRRHTMRTLLKEVNGVALCFRALCSLIELRCFSFHAY